MKIKVTKKEIMGAYNNVICIGYCDLAWLLRGDIEPRFYTCGVYGWNSDIYQVDNNTAICTGYRPFGNIYVSYNGLCSKYNEKARKIWNNYDLDYKTQCKKVNKLLEKFINECLESKEG